MFLRLRPICIAPLMAVTFTLCSAIAMTACAAAPSTPTAIGFEVPSTDTLIAGPGKNSEATVGISTSAVHTGRNAAEVDYSFSDRGYIEFQLVKPILIASTTEPINIALWVKGAGHPDFASVSLRLMDSRNNVFQYPTTGLAERFNEGGWSQFRVMLDPSKFAGTWGPSTDKKIVPPIRFFGFAAGHQSDAPSNGTLFLDDVSISPTGAIAATVPPSATIIADRDPLVIKSSDSVTFTAAFSGRRPDQGATRYRWRVRDFDGNVIAETPVASVAANASPAAFTFRPTVPGYFSIALDVLDDSSGVASSANTSLAVLAHPGAQWSKNSPFLIGVNSHLLHYSTPDAHKLIDLMRLAGFGIVRDGANWNGIEPQDGDWKWERMDDVVATLDHANIQLAYGLAYTAKWATTGNPNSGDWHDWNNSPPVTSKYVDFVKSVVNHYKPSVHYWEIWNEPDLTFWLGTADQYAEMLSAAIKAIHEADPSAIVMNGGISEVNFRPGFSNEFLTKTSPKPDVFAYHTHGAVLNMPIARTKVKGYLASAGMTSAPVWLNEAGISSFGGVSVREQAATLAKKIGTSGAMGDRAYIWYDMVDDGTDPNNAEHHFGVVANDFAPKPAFVAAHTVIDRLAGKTFDIQLDGSDDQTIYCYRGGGEKVAMVWSDRQGTINSVLLRSNATSATLTDLMGRVTTLKPVRGYYTVRASYDPCFFTVTGDSTRIETVKSVLYAPSATIAPGATIGYAISVGNPLTSRLIGTLSLSSNTVTATPSSVKIDVAPGQSTTVNVALKLIEGGSASQILSLRLDGGGSLPPINQETRLRTAEVIPSLGVGANPEERSPMVTLDPASHHLVSPYLATPMESLKFHGPDDLSAKVWLYTVAEGIRLHVAVNDDVHAADVPGSLWKGDSVQIAMVGPSEKLIEWTTALTSSGPRIERSIWPEDWSSAPPEQARITRTGTITTYDVTLPRTIPEIARAMQYGCRISLLVNDNDGAGRKGWLEWTPGIGTAKDPTLYVPVAFNER